MLETRERVFREHHLDSVESLRAAHAEGRVPELPVADVVVAADGAAEVAAVSLVADTEAVVADAPARAASRLSAAVRSDSMMWS